MVSALTACTALAHCNSVWTYNVRCTSTVSLFVHWQCTLPVLPVLHCALKVYTACAECTYECNDSVNCMCSVLCAQPACMCSEFFRTLLHLCGSNCTAGALGAQVHCTARATYAPVVQCSAVQKHFCNPHFFHTALHCYRKNN